MKKYLYSFLGLMLVLPCLAKSIPALLIRTDAAEQYIPLADVSKVGYSEMEMRVFMRNGSVKAFVIDDINEMQFVEVGDSSAVTSIRPLSGASIPRMLFNLAGARADGKEEGKQIVVVKTDKKVRKVIK